MRRVAAIDCGTNSLRLLVTDLDGDQQVDVHREMRIVRLGEDIDRTGRLGSAALDRTRAALADYAVTCREFHVERTRMVATSATRDAQNQADFRAQVLDVLGVEPEVITGAEEAALSFAGATRTLDVAQGPFLVLDIGGGSTELVLGTGSVSAARSIDIGCVRLTERHLHGDPPSVGEVEAARADIERGVAVAAAAVPVQQARTVVGLAGSVTTVAGLSLGLPAYSREAIHLSRLTAADVEKITLQLLRMTRAERAALPVMHPGRVDVIGAGALILQVVMEDLDLPDVVVSEADILDGIAWSLYA